MGNVRKVQPAAEIVKQLATEAEKLLRQWAVGNKDDMIKPTEQILAQTR